MHMVVRRRLGVYAVGGYVLDEFDRQPWEAGGGFSFYPSGTRAWRVNTHALHVHKSPAGSLFGYYNAGLTGTVISIGMDFLL
jgi:hypothetical protein